LSGIKRTFSKKKLTTTDLNGIYEEEQIHYKKDNESGVPCLVLQCINVIKEKGLNEMGIFRISSNYADLQKYLKLFQSGKDIDLLSEDVDTHLAAGLIKAYFRTLNEPVFPTENYPSLFEIKLIDKEDTITSFKSLFKDNMTTDNYNTIIYVFNLLNSIAQNSEFNLMTSRNIAVCWGPSLFHGGNEAEDILAFIIDHNETIFGNTESIIEVKTEEPLPKMDKIDRLKIKAHKKIGDQ